MTIWHRIATSADASEPVSLGSFLRGLAGRLGIGDGAPKRPEGQVAFTIAVIALSAKMAKADGVVVPVEVQAFNDIMKVPPEEAANVRRVFDLAKSDILGYEAYAQQVADMLDADRATLQLVLEGLFHIATADKALHPGEDVYLAEVARRFGFSDSEYRHYRGRFVISPERGPYEVLGLDPSVGDDDLKARYRRLAMKNHPDQLLAQGVPPEFLAMATRKMQAITEAYGRIARERGL